jgi:hypothetical protein
MFKAAAVFVPALHRPDRRSRCGWPGRPIAGLVVAGPAVAEPQEINVIEHATTDAVTDTGAKGDSAGDILTFANEVSTRTTRRRSAPTRASASARCPARHGNASGR